MHQKVCLLVENDPFQLRDLANLISENNLTVYLARDTAQGSEVLQTQTVDIVMCDLYMNSGDTPAIGVLKQHSAALPMIAIAKRTEKNVPKRVHLSKARANGADFVMESPFDNEKFRATVALAEKFINNGGRLLHAMIVGDSSDITEHCQSILENQDYRITLARTFHEALNVTCPLDVDVILMEFSNEQEDSQELIAQLAYNFPGVGIVAIDHSTGKQKNSALHLGANTLICETPTPDILFGAIKNAQIIAHSNLLRAAYLELREAAA